MRLDPGADFAWGAHFEDMETRGAALETTLSIWAESDPQAATRAALSGPRGEGHQRLLDAALAVWAGQDAEAALSFIASNLRDPGDRDASATTVLLVLAGPVTVHVSSFPTHEGDVMEVRLKADFLDGRRLDYVGRAPMVSDTRVCLAG